MTRLKALAAVAIVTAAACMPVRGAAPTLPPESIASDSVVVVHIDATHFNPAALQGAATAVLGMNASKVGDQLQKFKQKYEKAAAAGAEGVTLVMGRPKKSDAAAPDAPPAPGEGPKPDDNANSIAYVHLKPGADVKAIEGLITQDMKQEEKDKTVFEEAGLFLAVHQKNQPFPVTPDAAHAATFSDALGTISDASIEIAFVPDATTRKDMLSKIDDAPPALKDVVPLLSKSKWMTLAIMMGDTPSVAATANTANADDAKALADTINNDLADFKAQASNPGPGPMQLIGPIVVPLIDTLKPTTAGTQVTSTLTTGTIKTVANFAVQLGVLRAAAGDTPPPAPGDGGAAPQ